MQQNLSTDTYARLRNHPDYVRLTRQRNRLSKTLIGIVLAGLYLFIGMVAFQPAIIAMPITAGHVLTIGVPLAIGLMIVFWVLAGIYIYRANTTFDEIQEKLIHESMEKHHG